jgi:hypothetical protein
MIFSALEPFESSDTDWFAPMADCLPAGGTPSPAGDPSLFVLVRGSRKNQD